MAKPNYSYEKRQRELEKKKKKEEKAARKAAGGDVGHETSETGEDLQHGNGQAPTESTTDAPSPGSA